MRALLSPAVMMTLLMFFAPSIYAIDGRVLNANTHIVIDGATVNCGSTVTTTDDRGEFHCSGSPDALSARAIGFRASRVATSVEGMTQIALTPFEPKALYLSVYGIGSKSLRNSALALARAGFVNAIVIDIKGDRGLIPYPSAVPLALRDGARKITTIPNLSMLVTRLHQEGIYAIARIVTFKDMPLATARPDLAVKTTGGARYVDREHLSWTDPFEQEVRDYNVAIAVEAAQAGFDEIQFDYVRFPGVAQKLRFAEESTEASRVKAIGDFLDEARSQLQPFNVFLAVDIFGYVLWNTNDTGIGQRLEEISRHVDYIDPMLYPSCFQYGIPSFTNPVEHPYEIVRNSLENANQRLKTSPQHFRPWLQAFGDYAFDHRRFGPSQIAAQIRAAADFGSDGWLLWNPRNQYSASGLTGTQRGNSNVGR